MSTLSLKISLDEGKVVKTMQFDPSITVYDACKVIREKITEATGEPKDYGLFLSSNEDNKKGVWLEPARSLEYYILRNGDIVEYKRKLRTLRVRMLDGSVKTMMVDDSQIVANLMVVICTKIGITNYDEYSLVREEQKDDVDTCESKPNYGTLTLKRKHAEKERDAKMDQLRKKLHTDDEVNWVDPGATLREQGVSESETVLLRRKFFFSDRNVDGRDPVQLGLLYVQARDAILDGTHPVTQDKACEFAGIQCQIQFGDHKEDKHIAGFLDLKEFLPASYAKVKGIDKKVFKEHRKHLGVSELEAKVVYTKTARALKTYGVAFFLVKEKMKGKNKLVPRLLGVTKDSVLRLDEKTKEILQTWPLTTVRRWCASPNTFTLDFGDYSDQYYSVQTTEAEQILQVIAGYIDIILKKQRAKDHFGIEGDEGSTMVEDSVSPSKATILQHESQKIGKVNTESVAKPVVIRAGSEGAKPFATGHMTSAQLTTISGQINVGHTPPSASQMQQTKVTSVISEPQRALLSTISSGQEIIKHTEKELSRATLSEIGTDPGSLKWKEVQLDTKKQVVTSHIAAMNAATAQVVTLTSGPTEEVDHTAVGAAITTITSNLPEMTKGVQMIAALMDDTDNGDKLLDATRKLCSAFSDLLKAAEPETKEPRQNLLNAASRVGEASTQVLYTIGEETEENKEIQDILLALAKAVANTTAALVLKAKNVAATCRGDQPAQNRVIAAATQCALATSQLVACAKVVAPTLDNPACKQQLNSAAQQVSRAVHALLEECSRAVGADDGGEDGADDGEHRRLVGELQTAAADVSAALNQLLAHVEMDRRARETIHTTSLARVMSATERLMGSGGDAAEMVKQARLLGQVTAQLVQSIKTEAEQMPADSEAQRALWAAARRLADATARMVEAARACASAPHEGARRDALRRAARELREVAGEYEGAVGGSGERDRVVVVLQQSAKQATSNATQLITSAQNVAVHNTNKHSQEMLMQECRALADSMVQLVDAVRVSAARPSEASAQLELITASESFLQPSGHVVQASRAVLPTVVDQPSAKQLSDTTHQFSTSCTELRSAVHRARQSCKGLELDAAAEVIRSLQRELDEVDRAAKAFQLKPLPGDTAESSQGTLTSASRGAAGAVARLVSAARHGDEAGAERGAGDAAAALRQFAGGVRAVAATANDGDTRGRVVASGQDVMASSLILIETTKKYFASSEKVETSHILGLAKDITHALDQTVEAVPSHRDLDITIENINETLQILSMGEFPPTDKSYGQLQQELNQAAANLNQASTDVVQTVENPSYLGEASRNYGDNFNQLLGVSMEMAGQTKDYDAQTQMVTSMRSVGACSSRLLGTAKSVCQDPSRPNTRNQLAAAARSVTDAINHLVDVCTSAAPGQKECDNAVRSIQSTRPLLQNPSQPVNDLNYFSCVDTIIEQSKTLSEGMSGMANNTKRSDHEQFAHSVRTVSDSICGLVECTAQAAYLVAVSDETSVAGRPGLVDQAQFARASQAIEEACAGLMNPTSNQQQVLSAATVIAKHTSALCNACRVASSRTADPGAKRHFVQSAKDVANSTAALVKEIKALDNDYSEANRARCAQATSPLLDAVHSLCQFADSPEFASVPAKISIQAKRSQEAILESGRNIIKGSCSMVESAKVLAVQPTDKPQWQNLATHSKTVSDSIKSLVNNIRDKAPGQRECSVAVETLNMQMRELDQAALMAVSQSLQAKKGHSLQGYTEQIETTATEILERIEPLRVAAKSEAENLGHTVVQLVSYVEPLVQASIGAASNILETQTQMTILDQTKTVIEGATQLVLAAKESGGNPRATSAHADVEEQCVGTREAVQELMQSVRRLCTQHGLVSGLVDSVTRAVARITDHRMSLIGSYNEADSFVDYQTRMVGSAKEIARIATEMTSKSGTDVSKLATLAGELSQRYNQLAQDSVGAAATTTNNDVAQRIRSAVVDLGDGVVNLIKSGGQCQLTGDAQAQRQVADNSRHVNEKVGAVLAALQAGSKGTQACIDAVSTVAAIIGDLDTTILFASAGTLHAESDSDVFSDHRESILKTAKRLVEDTKTLVGGAAGSQEQLAAAAQNAVATIVQLAEVVKLGAMSLGSSNPDSQVMLIHAVRDVAAALKDLIRATKDASGKHISDPAMAHLKDSAQVMVTNVTSLLKTVKAVEDEHTRGTRALEATIEAIAQEIRLLLSPGAPRLTATPEELVRCTKQITVATARAVAAGNTAKQDDVIAAANLGRKAVGDVLAVCKAAAYHSADTDELRTRTLSAGRDTATAYRELLQGVLAGLQSPQAKQQLQGLSRRVAAAAADIVAVAEAMKGSDWVDPDDPTVIAENELLGAAASIDAAANKLAALRPRKNVKEADESLNFDEMILEAAKCIIAATAALVRAASAAQRELIDQGKVARRPVSSSDDGQWSEGLVSAARLVAAAAHSLVEAANALVQGYGSEEKLISSAKQVASSTAQLLVACKVKAEAGAESTRGLQAAGAAVIRSTDNLVRAARRAISHEDERSLVLNRRMVGGIAQEIDARSEVLRIERELEEARGRLTAIRQAKYKLRTGDASGDETDTELVIQHSDSSTDGRSYRNVSSANNSGRLYAGSPGFNNGYSSEGNNQPPKSPSDFQNKSTTSAFGTNTTTHQQSVSQHSTLERQQYTSSPKLFRPPQVPSSPAQHLSTFQGYSGSPLPSAPTQNYEGFTTRVPPRTSDEITDVSAVRVTSGRVAVRQTAVISDSRQSSGTSEERNVSLVEEKQSLKMGNGTLPNGRQIPTRDEQIADGSIPPEGVPPRKKKTAPPPPPRTAASRPRSYETRAYDTPRPIRNEYVKTEEEKRFENSQYSTLTKEERNYGYDSPRNVGSPMSPKFNARFDLPKFESTRNESLYSTIQKPTMPKSPMFTGDNAHQSFSETRKSTETLPSGKIASDYSVTSESYQSYPKVTSEFSKVETVNKQNLPSSFITSTPAKQDFGSLKTNITSTDLVKAVTPDYSRESISSPYGKDTYSYGGPNFMEETTTEVKEIPNGTQKITTTKIYSSSPVNLTSTNLKYDTGLGVKPIRLEGLDELSKGFESSDSRFSTLESRKFGSENSTTNRSFMRPSDFHDSEYQAATSVTKMMKKPSDLAGELDKLDSRFSKQTISSSEKIEKKTIMTSSSKSETSSTVTKKFGNF